MFTIFNDNGEKKKRIALLQKKSTHIERAAE